MKRLFVLFLFVFGIMLLANSQFGNDISSVEKIDTYMIMNDEITMVTVEEFIEEHLIEYFVLPEEIFRRLDGRGGWRS